MIEKIIRWWYKFLEYTYVLSEVEIKAILNETEDDKTPKD